MKRFSCWPWSRPLGTHDHTTDWRSSAWHISSFSHHQIRPQRFPSTCSVYQRWQRKGDRQKLITLITLVQRVVQQWNCSTLFQSLQQEALPVTRAGCSSRYSSRTLFPLLEQDVLSALQQDSLPVTPVGSSSRPYDLSFKLRKSALYKPDRQ
jgi:hypothetical protein